jgi:hypothetical protein
MRENKVDRAFTLRENREWLRYVFWGGAIGMGFLLANATRVTPHDLGKIIGSAAGVLLLSFSGFVFQTQRVVIDPLTRRIAITTKGFNKTNIDYIGFNEVQKLLLVVTIDNSEGANSKDGRSDRWSIALVLKQRSVPINKNEYTTKEKALEDANRIKQLLNVEMTDDPEQSIEYLAQQGRKIEAIALAKRVYNITLTQAKELVEGKIN